MTVDQMREAIIPVYNSVSWQDKVLRMHDNQVVAVYNNFLRTGKFEKKPVTTLRKGRNHNYHQMTLFDYV